MRPNRIRTRTATAVVVGLVPMVGALVAGSSTSTHSAAADAPSPVIHVEPAAQTKALPATHAAPHAPTATPVRTQAPARKQAPALPKSVRSGAVPRISFHAYRAAETTMAKTDRRCHIDWRIIAGIGRVESHHADLGATDRKGRLRTPIYGPTLDGTLDGNRVVHDTDGGRLDGDPVYDRAVGPMQFLPETWEHYAADGDGDGKSDPQNVFDAALTTARYLCDDGLDLRKAGDRVAAVLRYNNSTEYVNDVLGFARRY